MCMCECGNKGYGIVTLQSHTQEVMKGCGFRKAKTKKQTFLLSWPLKNCPQLKDKWEREKQSPSSIKLRDICNLKLRYINMKSIWTNGKWQSRDVQVQTQAPKSHWWEISQLGQQESRRVQEIDAQGNWGRICTAQMKQYTRRRRKIWGPRNLGFHTDDRSIKILAWQQREISGYWQWTGLKEQLCADWSRRSGGSRKGGLQGGKKTELTYYLTGLIGKLRGIVPIFKRVTEIYFKDLSKKRKWGGRYY